MEPKEEKLVQSGLSIFNVSALVLRTLMTADGAGFKIPGDMDNPEDVRGFAIQTANYVAAQVREKFGHAK